MSRFAQALLTAASMLCVAPFARAQDMKPSWPIPAELKWAAVNGYPMSYKEVGQGPTILLVHGSINDFRAWRAQFDELSRANRVIAVNLRHYFPERWKGGADELSVEQHGGDVAQFIKELNLDRVHLVGHSRGGAVVVETAKKHPEVIRTLTLVDGSIQMPVSETAESKEAAEFTKSIIGALQDSLRKGEVDKGAEAFVDALGGPGAWSKLPEPIKQMILDNIWTALGEKGRPETTCADLAKWDFPVLLTTGENSPKKYEFFFNEMRKCRAFPKTVVIPKAAHAMQRGNPEVFNKVLMEFVAQH